jgi:hypothetical protein
MMTPVFSDEDEDVFGSDNDGSLTAGSVHEMLDMMNMVEDTRAAVSQEALDALSGSADAPDADRILRSAGSSAVQSVRRAGGDAPSAKVRKQLLAGLAAVQPVPPADPTSLHNPGAPRPFKCPVCPQWFSSKGLLGKHLRERTDRCIPCGDAADRLEKQLGFEKCAKCSFYFCNLGSHVAHCKATPVVGDKPDTGDDGEGMQAREGNGLSEKSLQFLCDLPYAELCYYGTTIRLVPRKLRGAWRMCQSLVMGLFKENKPDLAWKLHISSFAMIWAPMPSQDASAVSVNKVLLKRMTRFMKGEFEALLGEARSLQVRDVRPEELPDEHEELIDDVPCYGGASLTASSLKRAKAQVRECAYGKAAQTLLSKQHLSVSDPEVKAKVQAQYELVRDRAPLALEPADLHTNKDKYEWDVGTIEVAVLGDKAHETDVDEPVLVDALVWVCGHLPRFRAQDLFGARYEHYQFLDDELIRHLVDCLMNGRVPDGSPQVLGSARGFIIDKGGGEPRCVHSVMCVRKIAARTAVTQDREWIGPDLAEVGQYGIGVKGGVEFVYHANRCAVLAALDDMDVLERDTLFSSSTQPAALQTDFSNAFPSIEQSKILEGIEDHQDPRVLRYARSARLLYDSGPPVVVFVERGECVLQLPVRNGCHQGDPFGGLHFSWGIRPLCAKVQEGLRGSSAVCLWIMDDCSFAGELESALPGYVILRDECPDYGLVLKERKLKAWLPLMADELVGLKRGDAAPELLVGVTDVEREAVDLVLRVVEEGFEVRKDGIRRVLGAPLTHDPVLDGEWVRGNVDEAKELMERIVKLEDPAGEFGLTRYCAATKLLHLSRSLAPKSLIGVLTENDATMRVVADHISGCRLTDQQWKRVKLPTRFGGNGWPDPLLTNEAAHVAGAVLSGGLMNLAAVREAVALLGSAVEPFQRRMMESLASTTSLVEAVTAVNSMAISAGAVEENICPELVDIRYSAKWPSQRDMSGVFHRDRLQKLMVEIQLVDRASAAFLRSCSQFGSGQWLHAVPMLHWFAATPAEWQMMWTTRIGVDVPNYGAVVKCKCGILSDASFKSGSHWHCVCKAAGVKWCIMKRHDVVVDILVDAARELDLCYEKELLGLYADSQGRPADILFPPEKADGRCVDRAVDVAITDCQTDPALEVYSDVVSLAAASKKEKKKRSAHRLMMAQHGVGLLQFDKVPFVLESSGAFGKEALKLWKWLKAEAKERKVENYVMAEKPHTWSAFTFQQMIPQRISFAVAKFTARAVIKGLVRSQRVSVFERRDVMSA